MPAPTTASSVVPAPMPAATPRVPPSRTRARADPSAVARGREADMCGIYDEVRVETAASPRLLHPACALRGCGVGMRVDGGRVDGRPEGNRGRSEEDPVTRVSEIMTSDVCVVNPEMTLRTALETLRARGVAGAPVMRGDTVIGVVSAADLL